MDTENKEKYLHEEITSAIISAFYEVYSKLGFGFLEKAYENSLVIQLNEAGLTTVQQYPIKVYYHDKVVGEYYADLIVEDKIIVELKAAEQIAKEHETQLINYLKATKYEVGLLLNFGKKPEVKRKIYTNHL